jgi:hypothetical protein
LSFLDGSVNDWGYKMIVTPTAKSSTSRSVVPVSRTGTMDGNQAISCFNTLFQVAFDGCGYTSEAIFDQLTSYKMKPFISKDTEMKEFFSISASLRHSSGGEEKDESATIESKTTELEKLPSACTSVLPSYRVNKRYDDVFVVGVTNVKVYEEPNDDSKIVDTLSDGQKLLIVEESGAWMKVKLYPEEDHKKSKAKGWVLRRKSDEMYVDVDSILPFVEEVSISSSVISTIDDISKKSSLTMDSSKLPTVHSMYDVQGKKEASSSDVSSLASKWISSNRLLFRDYDFLEQAMTDYSVVSSICFASDILGIFFSRWPQDLPLASSTNIPIHELIFYLNELIVKSFDEPSSVSFSASQKAKKLLELLIEESKLCSSIPISPSSSVLKNDTSHDPIDYLVHLSLGLLSQCSVQSSSSIPTSSITNTPVKKGKLQIIESSHPYEHNLNKDWVIKFPGCKRIEICFTEECCTETNYDFLTIYDVAKEKKLYPAKIHGYKNAGGRHWPGTTGCPTVILPDGVESCLLNFTTDSGTNDWGWVCKAYGVYELPSESQMKEYEEQLTVLSRKSGSSSFASSSAALPMWILTELSKMSSLSNGLPQNVKNVFFSVETFRCLIIFYNSTASSLFRSQLLDIFLTFIQIFSTSASTSSSSLNQEVYLDLKELESSLLRSSSELYNKEANNGEEPSVSMLKISSLLQAVVQLLITVENFILLIEQSPQLQSLPSTSSLSLMNVTSPMILLTADSEKANKGSMASGNVWEMFLVPQSSRSRSVVAWDIRLSNLPSSSTLRPVFGIVDTLVITRFEKLGQNSNNLFEIGFTEGQLLIPGNSSSISYGKGAKKWVNGDVISVILDRINGILTFAVNHVLFPVAVGPAKLQPYVEMNLINIDAYLAVSLPFPMKEDDIVISYNNDLSSKLSKLKQQYASPSLSSSSSSTTSSSALSFEWLSNVNDLSLLLTNITFQQIPQSILIQKLLPFCNKKSSLSIQLSSQDELSLQSSLVSSNELRVIEKIIEFPFASSISLLIHQLELSKDDYIEFYDKRGNLLLKLSSKNNRKKSSFENIDRFIYDSTIKQYDKVHSKYKNLKENGKGGSSYRPLTVGDKVVRGVDWKYGMEDGGAGSIGIVTNLKDWKRNGKIGSGIGVKWISSKEGFEGFYRYDVDGCYDIELLSSSISFPMMEGGDADDHSSEGKKSIAMNGTWLTNVNYLKMKIFISSSPSPTPLNPTDATSFSSVSQEEKSKEEDQQEKKKDLAGTIASAVDVDRFVKMLFFPHLSMSYCLNHSDFSSLKERLLKLYVSPKPSYLTELVQHINQVVRKKGIDRDDLLKKKWSDFIPSPDDLTRYSALKELCSLEAIKLSEDETMKLDGMIGEHKDSSTLGGVFDLFGEGFSSLVGNSVDPSLLTVSSDPIDGYLEEYAFWNGIYDFDDFNEAVAAAKELYPECHGITVESNGKYTLRKGKNILSSPSGEKSWLLSVSSSGSVVKLKSIEPADTLEIGDSDIPLIEREIDISSDDGYDVPALIENVHERKSESGDEDEVWEDMDEDDEDEESGIVNDTADHDDVEDGESVEGDEEEDEEERTGEELSHLFSDTESTSNSSRSGSAASTTIRPPKPTATNQDPVCGKCSKKIFYHPSNTWHNGWRW